MKSLSRRSVVSASAGYKEQDSINHPNDSARRSAFPRGGLEVGFLDFIPQASSEAVGNGCGRTVPGNLRSRSRLTRCRMVGFGFCVASCLSTSLTSW